MAAGIDLEALMAAMAKEAQSMKAAKSAPTVQAGYGPTTTPSASTRASPYENGSSRPAEELVAQAEALVVQEEEYGPMTTSSVPARASPYGSYGSTPTSLNSSGYPLRPGAQQCSFYMRTGSCKFGATCKNDHPELSQPAASSIALNSTGYPLRPGMKQCDFYMKMGQCKFGAGCQNDHPEGVKLAGADAVKLNSSGFPLRPGQEQCAFYLRTGQCRFGASCIKDHPELSQDAAATEQPAAEKPGNLEEAMQAQLAQLETLETSNGSGAAAYAAGSVQLNSHGFPLRPGMEQCSFYMKTGDCKFGSKCVKDHPEKDAPAGAVSFNSRGLPIRPGMVECAFYMRTGDCQYGSACFKDHPEIRNTTSAQPVDKVELNSRGFPLRPGMEQCAFWMRTGDCRFGIRCVKDHPEIEASDATPNATLAEADDENDLFNKLLAQAAAGDDSAGGGGSELNSAGFPLRPGAEVCSFYMKTGTCRFGATCIKDHPERVDAAQFDSHVQLNSHGLPIRPGMEQCDFYMRTGNCGFGIKCVKDHPEAVAPGLGANGAAPTSHQGELLTLAQQILQSASDQPASDTALNSAGFPLRPGAEVCSFYMLNGTCRFGATCRKDHPENRNAAQLNSRGYPLRPGMEQCAFYLRTGSCKFGDKCVKDHPEMESSGPLPDVPAAFSNDDEDEFNKLLAEGAGPDPNSENVVEMDASGQSATETPGPAAAISDSLATPNGTETKAAPHEAPAAAGQTEGVSQKAASPQANKATSEQDKLKELAQAFMKAAAGNPAAAALAFADAAAASKADGTDTTAEQPNPLATMMALLN